MTTPENRIASREAGDGLPRRNSLPAADARPHGMHGHCIITFPNGARYVGGQLAERMSDRIAAAWFTA